jgi:hypothetical protein
LAGMGYLERHSICQFGHCAVHTVFLVILGWVTSEWPLAPMK